MNLEQIQINLSNFQKFNRIKYSRFQQMLPNQNYQKVLNSIPLLLSVNNPKLPGYVDANIPYGVFNYTPGSLEKNFLSMKFGNTVYNIEQNNPAVQMLALIGSIGTIAYNKKSDFDYWVCVDRKQFTDKQYEGFRQKINKIQNWATSEAGTEIHLFVNDIDSVKKNIYDEDEDEAFGSTIGGILKDEFFRSSIIVCGKTPFWWVVPINTTDEKYEEMFSAVPEKIKKDLFLDIGNLYKISKEEFVGAALFQIIKSLGNPFKSILKLGVLEKYLFQPENVPLISHKIKHFVQNNKITNTVLDSYLMMFKEVYDYYFETIGKNEILNVLKMNLYLKINPQLSKYSAITNSKNIPYRVEEMFKYCKKWEWSKHNIQDLDNFDNWDFNRVLKFWDQVQKLMLLSYQKISSKIPDLNLQNRISESDFKLLVRKIRAQYNRGENKIPKYISFKDSKSESLLYIEPYSEQTRQISWILYKKINNSANMPSPSIIIHNSDSLIKLMAWAVINGVYDPKFSRLTMQSGYQYINKDIAIHFLKALGEFFIESRMETKNKFIVKDVFNILNFISLDFNLKTTGEIRLIDHIYYTSWDESFCTSYNNAKNLTEVFRNTIQDSTKQKKSFDDYCYIYCPEHYKQPYKDVISVFKESHNFFQECDNKYSNRLIAKILNDYVIFTKKDSRVESKILTNFFQLNTYISLSPVKNVKYHYVGTGDRQLTFMQYIFANSQPHDITVFHETKGNFVFIYIINESGNLFSYFKPASEKIEFLGNLFGFIENTVKQVREINRFAPVSAEKTRFYEVNEDKFNKMQLNDTGKNIQDWYLTQFNTNSALKAFISDRMGEEHFYNVVFPDGVESGYMNKDDFYAVTEKIKMLSKDRIKIYPQISGITFMDKTTENNLDSTPFFEEKYKLEATIEKFMKM
ncbi:MAG: class I adenylate cyclase [Spirochaetes bacterium]|nr:class I adenylate cyclase [Spirochaetota bacterium]